MLYTILMREGKDWRQYLLVGDERVLVVHMVPALWGGWKFQHVDKQFASDWPNMSRESIVAWKMRADDGLTSAAKLDDEFRERLIKYAEGGRA
jgi:hypothetical protein